MTMKKFSILLAAVAMMAMTACNEKPAKGSDELSNAATTEQVDQTQKQAPTMSIEKAAPTKDGKDHTVADFSTKDYQIKLENLADGTFRLTMNDKVVETKKCVKQGENYLMKDDEGKNYIIKSTPGSEEITIMDSKSIIYHGSNGK